LGGSDGGSILCCCHCWQLGVPASWQGQWETWEIIDGLCEICVGNITGHMKTRKHKSAEKASASISKVSSYFNTTVPEDDDSNMCSCRRCTDISSCES